MSDLASAYRPPAPRPLPPVRALLRAALGSERDLLSMLPEESYRVSVAPMGYSRRSILLVNEPQIVRRIMGTDVKAYPKNDLFVGALEPLVGNGVFISTGDNWRRQRRMIEPAFSQLRIERAFVQMEAAVSAME
ncbi:MAG: cytochrome P450, partial [Gammaproteobacteria bacterium]|nr:cytochrome P450 [Gammaproteobacteria bacterium]